MILRKHAGYRHLENGEKMEAGDVLVYCGDYSSLNYMATPEGGHIIGGTEYKRLGVDYDQACRNGMNGDFYPYRKTNGSTNGIRIVRKISGYKPEPLPLP